MNRDQSILVALALSALLLTACSDRDYGVMYCPEGPRDTLVVYPRVEFQQVEVHEDTLATEDHDPGMAGMPSLFLGAEGETRSTILVNFDFGNITDPDFPPEAFTLDNIRSIKFSLVKFQTYAAYKDSYFSDWDTVGNVRVPTGYPSDLYYIVRELEAPFAPEAYIRTPGPAPAPKPAILNSDFDQPNDANEPFLRLYPEDLLRWYDAGQVVGMELSLDPQSDPGLVGYASRELNRYGDLPPLQYGTVVAPNLVIEFNDRYEFLLIPPLNDTSTFVELPATEPGSLEVRHGPRSYPLLTFDMPDLPEGTCLSHMLLRLNSLELDSRTGSVIPWSPLEMVDLDLASGVLLEQELFARRSKVFLVNPDRLPPPEFEDGYFYPNPWAGHHAFVHPWPERVDMILGPPDHRDTDGWESSRTYYSRSTFHGPSAPEDQRPALLVIYGQKGDD